MARTTYVNGDPIVLKGHNCDGCQVASVQGMICHEKGCPEAWRDYPEEEEEYEDMPDEVDQMAECLEDMQGDLPFVDVEDIRDELGNAESCECMDDFIANISDAVFAASGLLTKLTHTLNKAKIALSDGGRS